MSQQLFLWAWTLAHPARSLSRLTAVWAGDEA
ncbi:hypothetical protein HNQ10_003905 [Deinococcus metallilatus]|uniref:Uncharacterized protein n=1 Tax=Deinococcus metallilatus TaxID=1211322 RepID=A0ABR6MYL6_9DEIO|nr:hypothetical protein [Deinococcus metallilatus]